MLRRARGNAYDALRHHRSARFRNHDSVRTRTFRHAQNTAEIMHVLYPVAKYDESAFFAPLLRDDVFEVEIFVLRRVGDDPLMTAAFALLVEHLPVHKLHADIPFPRLREDDRKGTLRSLFHENFVDVFVRL